MRTKTIFAFVCALMLVTTLSGCVVAFGNRVPPDALKPTLGKQLTDLKQARDSGVITEDEYQTARKRLIEGK
jgi:hypothetical protein